MSRENTRIRRHPWIRTHTGESSVQRGHINPHWNYKLKYTFIFYKWFFSEMLDPDEFLSISQSVAKTLERPAFETLGTRTSVWVMKEGLYWRIVVSTFSMFSWSWFVRSHSLSRGKFLGKKRSDNGLVLDEEKKSASWRDHTRAYNLTSQNRAV